MTYVTGNWYNLCSFAYETNMDYINQNYISCVGLKKFTFHKVLTLKS